MRRNDLRMRPRDDEKASKKRSPTKRRKRRPGLLKQTKRQRKPKGEKRQFDLAASVGLPKILRRKTVRRQQASPAREQTVRSVRDRKRRVKFQPFTSMTFNIRQVVASARILSFSLLLLSIYAIWLIGNNPRFYLSRIDIEGATIIQKSEIKRASNAFGTHIFAVEPAVSAELIQQLPGVLTARVDLVWPDRLHITIEEEIPVLNWQENGRDFWVNASGTLIPAFGRDMSLLTIVANVPPVLTQQTAGIEHDENGDLVEGAPPKLTYLDFVPLSVIETALGLKQEMPDIDHLEYSLTAGLQFQDTRGWTAKFGSSGDLAAKLNIYEAVVSNTQARGIVPEYINVAQPTKPVFKPLSGYTPPVQIEG